MGEPFYNENNMRITVYNKKTLMLRIDDTFRERDTDFIYLPSRNARHKNEKFRFYIIQNFTEQAGNEVGIWLYVYHRDFNKKIRGVSFSIAKGLNRINLPLTTSLESVVGVYRSPCYDIVTNEEILDFYIHFPHMTFSFFDIDMIPFYAFNPPTQADSTDSTPQVKKIKEVDLSEELSAVYQNYMNEQNYNIFFVVEDKTIGSFKFPLCAVSDVFRATLKEHTKESQTGEIVIDDFKYDTVKKFIDALHSQKIYFDDDPVMTLNIKMLANKYNVPSIEKAAMDAFDVSEINQQNFVAIYKIATLDNSIFDSVVQKFVEMKVDVESLSDFDQLNPNQQLQLFRSAHNTMIGNL